MDVYKKLEELGLQLPPPPAKGGLYSQWRIFADRYVYISGCTPSGVSGKLKDVYTVEAGYEFAKKAMLNVLAVLELAVGDLNKVKSAVKILSLVAGPADFYDHPAVANGGSQLLADLFGAENLPSRSAIGVIALPGNAPIETEAIFEFDPE